MGLTTCTDSELGCSFVNSAIRLPLKLNAALAFCNRLAKNSESGLPAALVYSKT